MTLNHTWGSDLGATLIAPNGATRSIFRQRTATDTMCRERRRRGELLVEGEEEAPVIAGAGAPYSG